MVRKYLMPVVCGWIGLLSVAARGGENLAVDASFESSLPAWFTQRSGTSYYAGKEQVRGAAEGRMVLAIDHRAEPAGRFTFDLFDAAGWTRATAASGARVELAPSAGGVLRISLPLSAADAVVLSKSDAR
jgi:hypothetical protein